MLLLFIILLPIALTIPCDSSCHTCSSVATPTTCTSCADNLYADLFTNKCLPLNGLIISEFIDGSFTADWSTMVSGFLYNNIVYAALSQFASSNGVKIYQNPDLRTNMRLMMNLPPHF